MTDDDSLQRIVADLENDERDLGDYAARLANAINHLDVLPLVPLPRDELVSVEHPTPIYDEVATQEPRPLVASADPPADDEEAER